MRAALYFPFSRCLDDFTLKQALLLYDRILFVDPVEPEERSHLYAGEIVTPQGGDLALDQAWLRRTADYRMLEHEKLVGLIDPLAHVPRDPALDLLAEDLRVDLTINRKHLPRAPAGTWQVLDRRLPQRRP